MGCKRRGNSGEAGYTLALVMVMASVLLVALSEAALNWQTAVKREREEELIFRGEQYQRALILWYAHWSQTLGTPQVVYPSTIEALLNTNNKRFLRQPWTDPVTNEEWRIIKVGPNNRPLLTVLPGNTATAPGGDRNPYGSGGSGQSQGSEPQAPAAAGQTAYGQTIKTQSVNSPTIGGIAGVASTSEEESLKTYNGRNKHNEWEFFTDFAALAARAQRGRPGGGRPGQSDQPGQAGQGRDRPRGQIPLVGRPGQSRRPPGVNPGNRRARTRATGLASTPATAPASPFRPRPGDRVRRGFPQIAVGATLVVARQFAVVPTNPQWGVHKDAATSRIMCAVNARKPALTTPSNDL